MGQCMVEREIRAKLLKQCLSLCFKKVLSCKYREKNGKFVINMCIVLDKKKRAIDITHIRIIRISFRTKFI